MRCERLLVVGAKAGEHLHECIAPLGIVRGSDGCATEIVQCVALNDDTWKLAARHSHDRSVRHLGVDLDR